MMKKMMTAAVMVLSMALVSCSSTPSKSTDSSSDTLIDEGATQSLLELNGSSDDNTAGGLKTVYFDYNSSSLTSEGKQSLEDNASKLKLASAIAVQIEGHCDERGGVQYNIALGEKRAQAVKNYLTALGVDVDRVTTVSYGKDRPNTFGHDDQAWSKNRRANFVITAK
jgi:peptidoglycan-associated lipoprotein